MQKFELPPQIADLVRARNSSRASYRSVLAGMNEDVELRCTLAGKLVGDIGAAAGAEHLGIALGHAKSGGGIDAHMPASGLR